MRQNTPVTELPRLSQGKLEQIIKTHQYFVWGRKGGQRAILKFMDLSDLDFSGKDLSYVDFTGSKLLNANLSSGRFAGAIFYSCDLRNAVLDYGDFTRADFRGAIISGASIQGSDLEDADLRRGQMLKFDELGRVVEPASDRARTHGPSGVTVLSGSRVSASNMSRVKAHGADFTDADLSGLQLREADLSNVNFEGANLSDTDLSGAELDNANFAHCIINSQTLSTMALNEAQRKIISDPATSGETLAERGQSLEELIAVHKQWVKSAGKLGEQMNISGADMRGTIDLHKTPLTAIRAKGTNFMGQDLHRANMQSAVLDQADFRGCKLTGADLRGSSLKESSISRADMRGAKLGPLRFDSPEGKGVKLQRTNLSGCILRYCDLSGADLSYAILMGADLTGANLDACDLRHADLTGALTEGADLSGAILGDTKANSR